MQRLGFALAAAIVLSGCFGDPPPDPEVQPLEIIVGNADPEYGPCLLNVDEVGAGTHDVTLMSMAGSATVRILDPSGAVLYERAIEEHRLQGGGHEVPQADQGSVRLASGNHRVECTLDAGTHTTTELLVVPARPGSTAPAHADAPPSARTDGAGPSKPPMSRPPVRARRAGRSWRGRTPAGAQRGRSGRRERDGASGG